MGAVQTLPTLYQLGASGRGVASFSTFVENSWVPTSALMLLFPMVFGNRTPAFWGHTWWGLSHFCEQFAYASIVVFVLAAASYSLIGRPSSGTEPRDAERAFRREMRFWWGACLVAALLALGEFTPLSPTAFPRADLSQPAGPGTVGSDLVAGECPSWPRR